MRLLVVSNRLPVTIVKDGDKLTFHESSGGLVSGLSAYLDSLRGSSFTKSEYIWVGWPGISVEQKTDGERDELSERIFSELNACPVFLTEKNMEKFYQGFCNKTIWPLFHYFPSHVVYDEAYWLHYQCVNEIFCDAVMKVVKPGDTIWIHDYHLMLLPKLLREKMPEAQIGFFLHIPFPSFEVYRLLPVKWRKEILEGLLGSDIIGFHTFEYTQYFLRCIVRILGYENYMGEIFLSDRVVKAETFPMGIDFQKFHTAAGCPEVQKEKKQLTKILSDFKVILSVDRLDYTKAIINRLQAYEIFLKKNPQWHRKVILVLAVVPSRIGVEHYRQVKKQIDEFVGKVNGRFGSIDWTPILYQYKFISFHSLVALYAVSDVALITPVRDGMNLIAKEYIASKIDKTGVLILSEMAGASKELNEAIIINPNNIQEIADALKDAMEMPEDKQVERNEVMQNRIRRYDVIRWADDFIQGLFSVKDRQEKFKSRLLDVSLRRQLIENFKKASKRLIFLDYDGTLASFVKHYQSAEPSKDLLKVLHRLSENPANHLILISGRDKGTLENWFSTVNMTLVAEHGAWMKEKNKHWYLAKPLNNDWKSKIRSILEVYADRLPGAVIEEKEFSLVWHYRAADSEHAFLRAKELTEYLVNFTANMDIQVLQGGKVVEVRCAGVNKGTAGSLFLSKDNYDFILAMGDDSTDEDIFKILPKTAYSIRIGMVQSYARFNFYNHMEAKKLLEDMA